MELGAWSRRFARSAMEFAFPSVCAWCRQPMACREERNPVALCELCQDELAPHLPHRCQRCSAPTGPYLDTTRGCIHCRKDRYSFEQVVSLGTYQGDLKLACLAGKQQRQEALVAALTRLLVQREHSTMTRWSPDVVIPAPHHWQDRLTRNHHASDLIAETLGRSLHIPVDRNLLAKIKRTPKQAAQSGSDRRRNLRGAFRANRRIPLEGARILLADDILTTGTTARLTANELYQNGAQTVSVAVLARAIGI